jgi:ABC-type sugar transport system substrate-binding protein
MKKTLAVILSIMMLAALLAGCQSKGESNNSGNTEVTKAADDVTQAVTGGDTKTGDPEPFTIGFPWLTSSTDPTFVSIVTNVRAAVEAAGGELEVVECDLTAEDLINNISDLISRGVDGIIFMPASDSMLPTVNQMCSEAGVYYSTMFRTINDEDIRSEIYGSEYFAGGCNEDDEDCAYNITKSMADMGVKNLCVINIAKGDASSDLRDKGIEKAVEETGIKLLNTTYGITVQTDMTKTIESYIAAYPELDGILLAGTYCDAALPTIEKALSDHNVAGKIKIGRIDFDFTMGQYLADGSFHIAYGGQQQIDPLLSTVILVNKVIGTPIVEDGPFILITDYLKLTTSEEADDFMKYFLGKNAVLTADEIKASLIKYYNSSINEDTFKQAVADFSVADVAARHEGMED